MPILLQIKIRSFFEHRNNLLFLVYLTASQHIGSCRYSLAALIKFPDLSVYILLFFIGLKYLYLTVHIFLPVYLRLDQKTERTDDLEHHLCNLL